MSTASDARGLGVDTGLIGFLGKEGRRDGGRNSEEIREYGWVG